jgi:hypothetical protein
MSKEPIDDVEFCIDCTHMDIEMEDYPCSKCQERSKWEPKKGPIGENPDAKTK